MAKNSIMRKTSIAAVVAVPALAVAFLGGNLLAGFELPSLNVSDTREFNAGGQNLAAPAKVTADDKAEVFLGTWQNTVRNPPSPRL
ncbi:MAG: hypothetical protein K1X57_14690 [Gemmataceae bacterium]|nr:hypothetical protein [Gemmataceae bacterium]